MLLVLLTISALSSPYIEPRCEKFPTRSDTNRAVQLRMVARGLKLWVQEEEVLYYPCSENKGADQLRSYCAADLRLCFRKCKNRFSHNEAHMCVKAVFYFGNGS